MLEEIGLDSLFCRVAVVATVLDVLRSIGLVCGRIVAELNGVAGDNELACASHKAVVANG